MKPAKQQSILVIEPNAQFREELYNFLLSAGYENVAAIGALAQALDKIRQSAYDVIVADAGPPEAGGLQLATDLAKLSPNSKIIVMIEDEEQRAWNQVAAEAVEIQFLIKTTFTQNLLYLIDGPA
jgi:DNA-binding NtrC family response regulator